MKRDDRLSSSKTVLYKKLCEACHHMIKEHNGYMSMCMHPMDDRVGQGLHTGTGGRCECMHISLIRSIHDIPDVETFDYTIYNK